MKGKRRRGGGVTRQQERGLILLVALGLLVGGVVLLWPRAERGPARWVRPIVLTDVRVVVPALAVPTKIDVNTADALELAKLPGIGAALAARIVEYREAHGSFRTLDELAAVKGIGAATVERLRDVATAGE
jgi:competence ComEA-like helix-hairpin-helix protein